MSIPCERQHCITAVLDTRTVVLSCASVHDGPFLDHGSSSDSQEGPHCRLAVKDCSSFFSDGRAGHPTIVGYVDTGYVFDRFAQHMHGQHLLGLHHLIPAKGRTS